MWALLTRAYEPGGETRTASKECWDSVGLRPVTDRLGIGEGTRRILEVCEEFLDGAGVHTEAEEEGRQGRWICS